MNNAFNASSTTYTAAPIASHSSSAVVSSPSPVPIPTQPTAYNPVIFMLALMAFMAFLKQS